MILLSGLPITIAVSMVLGWWLGSVADRHFGTVWVFQTAGTLLGVASAIRDAAVQIRRAAGKDADEPEREPSSPGPAHMSGPP